ncbi:MAG: CCA tRNA nucleotidyltransferase [Chitinispirillaceae bacterium]|nr:CCA tRNA nucleotidyltransferase [Chitinispirillaceae bacterium]
MKQFTDSSNYSAAMHIIRKLVSSGYEALFAGGSVRDMLLSGRIDGDIDIATNALPEAVSRLFPQTVPVGAKFGVVVVIIGGVPFEVATFRSDRGIADGRHPADVVFTDARNDALRRDFTVNGLFYDPVSGEIHDYVNGREDLSGKVIRAIGNPDLRFSEDYLRMLRAVRFAARFSFSIEEATWEALQRNASHIKAISVERIFGELDKMLCGLHPDHALALLDTSGLLEQVLPEVASLKGVGQPPQFHPEGDVFEHTRKALSLLGKHPSPVLAWSVLLHDIGKPATMTVSDRIRFNGHDQAGAKSAWLLLRKLHSSNVLADEVEACIANHMNMMQVKNMRLGTLKKLLARPTIDDELELHRIDCLASHGNTENYGFLREQRRRFAAEQIRPEPLLRGRDLVELGLSPGPLFGEMLSAVYDLQLEEVLSSKEDALKWLRERYPQLPGENR